jgi:DNA polymerase IV
MHLDMNSYFASVEQQDNSAWRGKPVGVCEHLGGIIIAASVEAKKWGIKTGTPVWEARKLYPKIILTPTRPERYRFFNRRMVKVVSDYASAVEVYSIDEVFVDLTKACNVRKVGSGQWLVDSNPFEEAVNIALEIKRRFKTEVGDWLRCSIGLAENKLLAKIASDLRKPDGLVVIKNADCALRIADLRGIQSVIRNSQSEIVNQFSNIITLKKPDLYQILKLTDIPGIGRRQEKNLNNIGIHTLKELRDFPQSHLVSRFGNIMGHHLYNIGQLEGTWKAPVHQEPEIKSMGHMYTLPREYRKPEFFLPVLYKLCEMVGRRLRKKQLMGNIISCYYHDKDYVGFGDSQKLKYFLQDGREIFLQAEALFRSSAFYQRPNQRLFGGIKLIGITVAGLRPYVNQLSLFGDAERQKRLTSALDKINDKYGEFTILRAKMMSAGKVFRDSIGFGRVKELG